MAPERMGFQRSLSQSWPQERSGRSCDKGTLNQHSPSVWLRCGGVLRLRNRGRNESIGVDTPRTTGRMCVCTDRGSGAAFEPDDAEYDAEE